MLRREQKTRVRDTTGNLPAIQAANAAHAEKRKVGLRTRAHYFWPFCSDAVAHLDDFYDDAEQILFAAVMLALDQLETDLGNCMMDIVSVQYIKVEFPTHDDQQVKLIGHIICVPMPGEVPNKGPKRKVAIQQER